MNQNKNLSLSEELLIRKSPRIYISKSIVSQLNNSEKIYGKYHKDENLIRVISINKEFKGMKLDNIGYTSNGLICINNMKISFNDNKYQIVEDSSGIEPEITVFDIEDYNKRNKGLVLSEKAANKSVLLIGAGSVGSRLTKDLVSHGVDVHIVDCDTIEISNNYRWGVMEVPELSVGRQKVSLLKDILERAVPNAKITAYYKDFSKEIGFFDNLLSENKFDLIIVSTDIVNSHTDAMVLAYNKKTDILYVLLGDGAESGMIAHFSPDSDSCYLCYSLFDDSEIKMNLKKDNRQYGLITEEEQHGVPALSVDIGIISSIASKICLAIISGDDSSQYFKVFDSTGNIIFFSTKPDTWIFEDAFQKICIAVEKNPECPLCGKPNLVKEKHKSVMEKIAQKLNNKME